MKQAITDAISKAAGVFPADFDSVLLYASKADWEVISWIESPESEDFVSFLHSLGENLVNDQVISQL